MNRRHIILVGLPGSGKTTAGALAAGLLGAPFRDVDRIIASRQGHSITRLFAERGEEWFRRLEHETVLELLQDAPAVLSPGGGWFQEPAQRREGLRHGFCIYLAASPGTAAARLGPAAGTERPLLAGGETTAILGDLLARREAAYLEAQGQVATDALAPAVVARRIAELARAGGGW